MAQHVENTSIKKTTKIKSDESNPDKKSQTETEEFVTSEGYIITDNFVGEIDKRIEAKEKEILTI